MENLKKKKKKEILEEIINSGFSEQNEFLKNKGFLKLRQNLFYLTKCKGDQEKALVELKNKIKNEDDSSKSSSSNEKIEISLEKFEFRIAAEKSLAQIALEMAKLIPIRKTFMIYDSTNIEKTEGNEFPINNEISKEFQFFTVYSAFPEFKSADDALVNYALKMNKTQIKKESMFVTSDKGLQMRLLECGSKNIMRTGVWFTFIKNKFGSEWFQKIINKVCAEQEKLENSN